MAATPIGADPASAEDDSDQWSLSLRSAEAAVLAQFARAHALAVAADEHEHSDEAIALSQSELAKATGLSQPTVSRALDALLERGVIAPSEARQEGRGHPTTRWYVTDRFYVVGINLRDDFGAPGHLYGVATRLDGRLLHNDSQNLDNLPASVEEVVDGIAALTVKLRKAEDPHRLVGVGVSLGGHVSDAGIVRSYNLGWAEGVALQKKVHDALSEDNLGRVAVVVENNANSVAASLNPRGGPAQWRAVVIVDHRGIGCGLFLNDALWRGDHGKAGELGHVPVPLELASRGCLCTEDGPINVDCRFACRCGGHGCLETISTPQAITRAVREDASQGAKINTIEGAAKLLEDGDAVARRVFEFAGKALGFALTNLVLTIDPKRLRLGGLGSLVDEESPTGKVYLAAMHAVVDRHGFSRPNVQIETYPRPTAESIQDQAAAAVAVDVVQRFLTDQV